jgi:hypothetical protein
MVWEITANLLPQLLARRADDDGLLIGDRW